MGVYPSMHWGRHPPCPVHAGIQSGDTPSGRTPTLGKQTPPGQTPTTPLPPPRRPLQWTVHILLECILVDVKMKMLMHDCFLCRVWSWVEEPVCGYGSSPGCSCTLCTWWSTSTSLKVTVTKVIVKVKVILLKVRVKVKKSSPRRTHRLTTRGTPRTLINPCGSPTSRRTLPSGRRISPNER